MQKLLTDIGEKSKKAINKRLSTKKKRQSSKRLSSSNLKEQKINN